VKIFFKNLPEEWRLIKNKTKIEKENIGRLSAKVAHNQFDRTHCEKRLPQSSHTVDTIRNTGVSWKIVARFHGARFISNKKQQKPV